MTIKVNLLYPNLEFPEIGILEIDNTNDKLLITDLKKKSKLRYVAIKRTSQGLEYFITNGTRIYLSELQRGKYGCNSNRNTKEVKCG